MDQAGRPRKEIDWDLADRSAALFCTGKEISSILGVSYDTLVRRLKERGFANFAEWYDQKSGPTLKALRRKQLDLALAGDRVMLIWLGKQLLGQAEKQEVDQKVSQIKIDADDSEL